MGFKGLKREDFYSLAAINAGLGAVSTLVLNLVMSAPTQWKEVLFWLGITVACAGIVWVVHLLFKKKAGYKRAVGVSVAGVLLAIFSSEAAKLFLPGTQVMAIGSTSNVTISANAGLLIAFILVMMGIVRRR